MTQDEQLTTRQDAQQDMARAMGALTRASRRLRGVGSGAAITVEELRHAQDSVKQSMEFNGAVMKTMVSGD